MKKMMELFAGITLTTAVMTPIAYLGLNSVVAGAAGTLLTLSGLLVLIVLYNVDRRSRTTFTDTINKMRTCIPLGHEINGDLDYVQLRIAANDPLVDIARDLGVIHGHMEARGFYLPDDMKPEALV